MCIIGCNREDKIKTHIGGFCSEECKEYVTRRIAYTLLYQDAEQIPKPKHLRTQNCSCKNLAPNSIHFKDCDAL